MNGHQITNLNSDPLMSAAEASVYLRLSPNQSGAAVRHLARIGRLAHVRIAGKVLFRKSVLEAFIAANTTPARATG